MPAELDWLYVRMRPAAAVRRLVTHICFQGRQPTMRWLWLNTIYDRVFRAIAERYPLARRVDRPIFILGVGRSGTTILGKLLSFHHSVGFLNEAKAMWHVIYPAEDILGTYQVEQRRYRLGADEVTPRVRERAYRLYSAYLSLLRADRIVDKYPEALYRIPFLLALFGDAKLVIILRNGQDTASSIAKYSRANARVRQGKREDWWGVEDQKWCLLVEQIAAHNPLLSAHVNDLRRLHSPEDRAVIEWTLSVYEAKAWLNVLSRETVKLVLYEDLLTYPETTLRSLLEFCELEDDPELFWYAKQVLRMPKQQAEALPLTPWVQTIFEQATSAFALLRENWGCW